MTLTFHRDVFLPSASIQWPSAKTLTLRYSAHAENAAKCDRYGDLTAVLPKFLDMGANAPFEVETDDRLHAIKACYRLPATESLDVVVVVTLPEGNVKTVWGNLHDDNHKTLQASRYFNPG
jgi:hypothetical protein